MGASLEARLAATALRSTEVHPLEDAITLFRPEEVHAVLRSWQRRGWWTVGDLGFLSLGRPTPAGVEALRELQRAAAPELDARGEGPTETQPNRPVGLSNAETH